MTSPLQIRGLAGALGAELRGIDLSRPLDATTRKALDDALYRYGVLCIRDQQLDPESLLALAKSFGHPDVHPGWLGNSFVGALGNMQSHNKGGNWVFADSHARWMKLQATYTPAQMWINSTDPVKSWTQKRAAISLA